MWARCVSAGMQLSGRRTAPAPASSRRRRSAPHRRERSYLCLYASAVLRSLPWRAAVFPALECLLGSVSQQAPRAAPARLGAAHRTAQPLRHQRRSSISGECVAAGSHSAPSGAERGRARAQLQPAVSQLWAAAPWGRGGQPPSAAPALHARALSHGQAGPGPSSAAQHSPPRLARASAPPPAVPGPAGDRLEAGRCQWEQPAWPRDAGRRPWPAAEPTGAGAPPAKRARLWCGAGAPGGPPSQGDQAAGAAPPPAAGHTRDERLGAAAGFSGSAAVAGGGVGAAHENAAANAAAARAGCTSAVPHCSAESAGDSAHSCATVVPCPNPAPHAAAPRIRAGRAAGGGAPPESASRGCGATGSCLGPHALGAAAGGGPAMLRVVRARAREFQDHVFARGPPPAAHRCVWPTPVCHASNLAVKFFV